jgi:hypothetical protein
MAMQTIELSRSEWPEWLDRFTQVHVGWLVSVDVLRPDLGAQREIDNLPLIGVSADRVEPHGTLVISVGRSPTLHLTHVVHDVTRLHVERTDAGADAALQIASSDGSKTILRFRVAALPEMLDGTEMSPEPGRRRLQSTRPGGRRLAQGRPDRSASVRRLRPAGQDDGARKSPSTHTRQLRCARPFRRRRQEGCRSSIESPAPYLRDR